MFELALETPGGSNMMFEPSSGTPKGSNVLFEPSRRFEHHARALPTDRTMLERDVRQAIRNACEHDVSHMFQEALGHVCKDVAIEHERSLSAEFVDSARIRFFPSLHAATELVLPRQTWVAA